MSETYEAAALTSEELLALIEQIREAAQACEAAGLACNYAREDYTAKEAAYQEARERHRELRRALLRGVEGETYVANI